MCNTVITWHLEMNIQHIQMWQLLRILKAAELILLRCFVASIESLGPTIYTDSGNSLKSGRATRVYAANSNSNKSRVVYPMMRRHHEITHAYLRQGAVRKTKGQVNLIAKIWILLCRRVT